jgi:hypothetical protein
MGVYKGPKPVVTKAGVSSPYRHAEVRFKKRHKYNEVPGGLEARRETVPKS